MKRPALPIEVPAYVREREDVWRIVADGMATLAEVEGSWTLVDVWDANVVLDIREDAERLARTPTS